MSAFGSWTWTADLTFYRDALGLVPQREMTMEDRGWHLVFLGDNETPFQLELCKEIARTQPYRLGTTPPRGRHRQGI